MDLIVALAIIILAVVFLSAVDLGLGLRSMTRLETIPPIQDGPAPMVSVVVPACNEEKEIAAALGTLLQQEYRHLEIIAVNDRSVDGTGAVLEKLRQQYPDKLKVFHVTHLPAGWMGKNHALHFGAERARGEYLLFTDGDIHLEKSTVARALGYMQQNKLDHVSLLFQNSSPGILLNSLILDAGIGLMQSFRPWRAKIPSSRCSMGVGAFNLVRRSVYERIGGFAAISMHPVDDIMLGKLIKSAGFRQECLLGQKLVSVPWYESVGQMVEGLSKNVLAVISYRFFLVPPLLAVLFLLNIFPLWGLVLFDGAARSIFGAAVLIRLAVSCSGARIQGISRWCALGTLLSPYLVLHIFLHAAWRNARDGGIYWRGTHYSLAALRNNKKVLF